MKQLATKEWVEVAKEINKAVVDTAAFTKSVIGAIGILLVFPIVGLVSAFIWFISLGHCHKALGIFAYSVCRIIGTLLVNDSMVTYEELDNGKKE